MKYLSTIVILLLYGCNYAYAQAWLTPIYQTEYSFQEAKASFQQEWDGKSYQKSKGFKQYSRWARFMEERVDENGMLAPDKLWKEVNKYKANHDIKTSGSGGEKSVVGEWEFIGPYHVSDAGDEPGGMGRINCLEIHPVDHDIMYAGTPSGGLWRTTNGGIDWEPLTDNLPIIGVSDVKVAPSDPSVMYMATGDCDGGHTYTIGMMRSDDAGETWTPAGLDPSTGLGGNPIDEIAIHPYDDKIVIAATGVGLFKTTNGGTSWSLVTGMGWFRDVKYKLDDPNVLFATGYEFTLGTHTKFYRSENGGNDWYPIQTGIPTNEAGRMVVALTPDDPDYVYVLAAEYGGGGFLGLYRSTNGGNSFAQMADSPELVSGQSAYNLALCVSPTNKSELYAGGVSLFKSTDEGATWEQTIGLSGMSNYVHVDIHDLDFYPESTGTLFASSDGGLYKSTNNGVSWKDLSDGLHITQFYSMDLFVNNPSVLLGGTQDNGLLNRTTPLEWGNTFNSDVVSCEISPTHSDSIFVVTNGGSVWRQSAMGYENVLNPYNTGIWEASAWDAPFIMHPHNSNKILIGYQSIWKSDDHGDSWNNISGLLTSTVITAMDVAPSQPDEHIYASDGTHFFKTNNGGISWVTIDLYMIDGYVTDIEVSSDNPYDLLMSTGQGKVYSSLNGGDTWTDISGDLPAISANAVMAQPGPEQRVYVAMDVGVYYRDVFTPNWQPFFDNLPNVMVYDLEINPCEGKLYAATFGRGIWSTDIEGQLLNGVSYSIDVNLEGCFDNSSGFMENILDEYDLIPLSQPYSESPWYYDGEEYVNSIPNNVVDWVLLELRSQSDADQLIATKAAFLKQDGSIVEPDGSTDPLFCGIDPVQSYYIVVRHRNHMAIMSDIAKFPGSHIDLTDAANVFGGFDQVSYLGFMNYAMKAGDIDANGVITVDDFNVYAAESAIINDYLSGDCNMDRTVTVTDLNMYKNNASSIAIPQVRYD